MEPLLGGCGIKQLAHEYAVKALFCTTLHLLITKPAIQADVLDHQLMGV